LSALRLDTPPNGRVPGLSLTCLPCLPVPLERQIGPAQAGAEIGQKGAFFKGLRAGDGRGKVFMPKKGLIIVFTGDGKGKTTAAMGMAFRAVGHGLSTLMIQFIKGSMHYGELEAAKRLAPHFKILPMGRGFVRPGRGGADPEDIRAVREAWDYFLEEMGSGTYDMIILDEINYAVKFGLISVDEVLEGLRKRPPGLHLVLTGRDARKEVVEMADLATEMREIKHPFQEGIKAQQGIEY